MEKLPHIVFHDTECCVAQRLPFSGDSTSSLPGFTQDMLRKASRDVSDPLAGLF
jgi:hypothetical protein